MESAEQPSRVSLVLLAVVLLVLAVSERQKWLRRLNPRAKADVEAAMSKKIKFPGCVYCGRTFANTEERNAHWLEYKGQCKPAQSVGKTDSET